jgi:acetylornithine deacetylase/succinyl-diaminopimelate desuccinylase-like protein
MDNDGKITIPGFYDDVQPISDAEQENISKISNVFDRTQFQKDTGNARLYSYTPMDIIQKTWTQPSFEIHGFVGAQDNPHDFKTAIPYEVRAKVSMRIVLNQDSVDILQKLRKHLQTFDKNIQVTGDGTRAAVSDRTQSIFTKAAEACAKGFGQKPLFVASGGTIGAVPKMQAQFPGVPIVMIAQSLMSDGYHAPNEEFRLDQACKGMKTMVYYLRSLVPQ